MACFCIFRQSWWLKKVVAICNLQEVSVHMPAPVFVQQLIRCGNVGCYVIVVLGDTRNICHDTYHEKVSRYSILWRVLIVHTINLISCFCYCRLCCVSAITHAVTTSFYNELTDLLDCLAVLIQIILLI